MTAADGGVPTRTARQPGGPRPVLLRMPAATCPGQLNNPAVHGRIPASDNGCSDEAVLLLPLYNDIDTKWLTFKHELQHSTLQFIPTMRNSWKEEGWTRPLNRKIREYISKNIDFELDIWKPVIVLYLKI